jgi:hypothetical protein
MAEGSLLLDSRRSDHCESLKATDNLLADLAIVLFEMKVRIFLVR